MSDLSDLPGDDAAERASRYLDGDLGLDERARAEADPEVMAWVERFRGIQQALREPVAVDGGARDAAITAALAALDEQPTGGVLAPPPGVGDLAAARARRTRGLGAWLGSAAAVVALGVAGAVLVANSGGSDDASDESIRLSAAVEAAATTVAASDEMAAADSASTPMMATPGSQASSTDDDATRAGEAATTAPGVDAQGEPSTDEETAGGAPADTQAATDTTAAGAATTAGPATSAVESYRAPADLEQLADATPVTMADGREAPCADVATGELVAVDVAYRDVAAVVYRDAQLHTLTAWAVGSCDRLAEYVYPAG